MSIPTTFSTPNFFPINIKIPEPHPISSNFFLFWAYFSKNSTQSEVVSCVPVPKASPGSISTTISLSDGSYSSQLGFITILSVIFTVWKYFFHSSCQSSSLHLAVKISYINSFSFSINSFKLLKIIFNFVFANLLSTTYPIMLQTSFLLEKFAL